MLRKLTIRALAAIILIVLPELVDISVDVEINLNLLPNIGRRA